MSRHGTFGCGSAFGDVDHDLFGCHALLELAHLGMLPPSTEGAGRFHWGQRRRCVKKEYKDVHNPKMKMLVIVGRM